MRVLMFQDRFAELVVSGKKRQTVRKRARCMAGDTLSLRKWKGKPRRSGSKHVHLLEATCIGTQPIRITKTAMYGGGVAISEEERNRFARADGFATWEDMVKWFEQTHGLPCWCEAIWW